MHAYIAKFTIYFGFEVLRAVECLILMLRMDSPDHVSKVVHFCCTISTLDVNSSF